ncbi:hypothetical protein ACHAQA_006212 [Verticillium albo-atrum]
MKTPAFSCGLLLAAAALGTPAGPVAPLDQPLCIACNNNNNDRSIEIPNGKNGSNILKWEELEKEGQAGMQDEDEVKTSVQAGGR